VALKELSLFRIGFGNDVHRLVRGRPLILGGVRIEYEFGLEGHSDADVLLHAIMDAILGAVGAGDIGRHFPDSDPSFLNADSMELLSRVVEIAQVEGFAVNNVDATVVAQHPRLAPYMDTMREGLARVLGVPSRQVNIKATTTEGLGYCGRGEAMEAFAVVSLVSLTQ
jgi:2-C-methyl-D-erythritol 2,4-cyclodiphosphate synthase